MPFPYTNNEPPTPAGKNTLSKIATSGIRDFLLNKNIISPTKYPYLGTSINGSPRGGEPVLDTSVGTGQVIKHPRVGESAIKNNDTALRMNRYKNENYSELVSIENVPYANGSFPRSTPSNGVGDYPADIETKGLLAKTNEGEYRIDATTRNLYLDVEKQCDMADYLTLQPVYTTQQIKGYLDKYGSLNIEGSSNRAADIIGSVLNGQGLGIGSGGIVTNFDLRASLAGRVLTATGLMNDTRLGVIGGQQLALALANNAAFNAQQATIGRVNLNAVDLFRGGQLLRSDYTITVGSSTGGKVLDYTERILGFEVPRSKLSAEGSIFSTESGLVSNIDRANEMLKNTSRGQKRALATQMKANMNGIGFGDSPIDSPFRTGYVPGFQVNDKFILNGNPSVYAYASKEGFIIDILGSVSKTNPIPIIGNGKAYGFTGPMKNHDKLNNFGNDFSWNTNNKYAVNSEFTDATPIPTDDPLTKKSLLVKTQILFDSLEMKTIIASKGDMREGISKGSAVKSSKALLATQQTAEDTYCRAWTTHDRYDKVQNLIRHRGLNKDNDGNTSSNKFRYETEGSVLDDNGFVKIGPYVKDDLTKRGLESVKQYMFSIENLAWAGSSHDLVPVEQGSGDLFSNKFGRIMWFPPYDINFTENNSANWESNTFIGRGEPVYTYNNSERTGTLSFKLVVDHSSEMNSLASSQGPADDYIASYFAGCQEIGKEFLDKLKVDEVTEIEKSTVITPKKLNVDKELPPPSFNVYYNNAVSTLDVNYENGDDIGVGNYKSEAPYSVRPQVDRYDFGLNGKRQEIKFEGISYKGWLDPAFKLLVKTQLREKCPHCKVEINGYASTQGITSKNDILAEDRANKFFDWFLLNMLDENDLYKEKRKSYIKGVGEVLDSGGSSTHMDSLMTKEARKVTITFVADADLASEEEIEYDETTETVVPKVSQSIINRYYSESSFFEKLTKEDPFVFDEIRQKIRYFHPAFHSTTPEGLNSRLTFLSQCTRQGPTNSDNNPKNLAFGAPPICILRIGDFYNTKIVIENIDYSFEPLVWDLNPEGIGVQPMMANVSMSFKFIGGSSLKGPINKLQNALSFNYFANSHVYDSRADYVAQGPSEIQAKSEISPAVTVGPSDSKGLKGRIVLELEKKIVPNIEKPDFIARSTSDLDKIEFVSAMLDRTKSFIVIGLSVKDTVQKSYQFTTMVFDPKGNQLGSLVGGVRNNDIVPADTGNVSFQYYDDITKFEVGKNYSVKVQFENKQKILNFIA